MAINLRKIGGMLRPGVDALFQEQARVAVKQAALARQRQLLLQQQQAYAQQNCQDYYVGGGGGYGGGVQQFQPYPGPVIYASPSPYPDFCRDVTIAVERAFQSGKYLSPNDAPDLACAEVSGRGIVEPGEKSEDVALRAYMNLSENAIAALRGIGYEVGNVVWAQGPVLTMERDFARDTTLYVAKCCVGLMPVVMPAEEKPDDEIPW